MLRMNQLIGFGPRLKAPASVSYVGRGEQYVPGTSVFTFTGASIGAAVSGRKVVIGAKSSSNLATVTATLGGAPMTRIAYSTGAGAFFAIDQDVGTTANIVLTNSVNMNGFAIGIWNVFNGADLPYDTQIDTSLTSFHNDVTLNCPAGSVALAISDYRDLIGISPTTIWTGLTERFDTTYGGSTTLCTSGADGVFATATSRAVQSLYSGASSIGGSLLAISL